MRGNKRAAAVVAIAFGLGAADAARAETFNIAPGRLGEVAAAIGARAGITVAVTDPELAGRLSPGVRGTFSVRAALERALRGTGAEAVFYDRVTVRIIRARAKPRPVRQKPAVIPLPMPDPPAVPDEIVVTASKQNILLENYPGSAKIIDFEPAWLSRNGARGTAALTETLPTLSSTNLGRGRNKLYVRGISDSSFNGPTQATVGQYLGDARLNYNAPDPDLNLYDLKRVEVLAGPQGTLYGAGSLGGVVRLVPNAPDSAEAYATASTGVSATRFGGIGGDAAAMLNLPLAKGRMALRLVVYGTREPGYIDDPSRNLRDINDSLSFGQRLMFRMEDLAGWTIDAGMVVQNIKTDDGQYVLRGDPPLERSNALAQPFRNDYRLAYVTARRPVFGGTELVSTTSFVLHDLKTVFDATGSDGTTSPRRFEEKNNIALLSNETRLWGGGRRTPWVAGMAGIYSVSRLSRLLGSPDDPSQIAGVRNRQVEFSLFGQASHPIASSLIATGGGRLTVSDGAGTLLDAVGGGEEESSRARVRFAGSAALDWHLSPSLSAFLHYQQGFRPGGFAVASGSVVESQEFEADDLSQIELGIRWRDKARDRLSIRAAIFGVDWNHVQADLVDDSGLPATANIGSGRVYGLDGEITWRALPAWTLTVAAFLNYSNLIGTASAAANADAITLPNVPRDGVRVGSQWRFELARDVTLTGEASAHYVGQSHLGATPPLDVMQGQYLVSAIGARIDFARFGISLDISNIGDARANTFAFGNPFGLGRQNQVTPLRPRTIRLGLDARF
ncbi:TonB-dependent receptor domain-containing protein [Sphingomonas psychrotolerans]|uniref:TonB-dependent receptor n=1 Tax=Sphingomonas psychrotolerans TaxID=1327635 RepID=A0A2K8ME92_9SPHN|nr:TonB-dependent receptor [Sphingomonas psychrotolerans]ATY32205.1 TonB-dependent receptor [Sphingomonas psychrotolerans]